MENYPKLMQSYPNLENLLEPIGHELWPCNFHFLPLFKYNLVQLWFLLRNLTMFHHEHLVLIIKLQNTSWLVMSGVKKYQTPLSSIIKCS
jgi:hypothetical protein